jgi:hypothetical protein
MVIQPLHVHTRVQAENVLAANQIAQANNAGMIIVAVVVELVTALQAILV